MTDHSHEYAELLGSANPFRRTPRLRLMAVGQLFNQELIQFDNTDELLEAAAKLVDFVAGEETDEPDPTEITDPLDDDFGIGGYV